MGAYWKDKNGEYKEFEFRCADTKRDAVKFGYTIYPDPSDRKKLKGEDRQGVEHDIYLFNITDNKKELE